VSTFYNQPTNLVSGTTARASDINNRDDATDSAFDNVEAVTIRSIKLPVGTSTDQIVVETAAQRVNKTLGFDSTGALTLYSPYAWRGEWVTGVDYTAHDVVRDPVTKNIYFSLSAHTATTSLATDTANWSLSIDVQAVEDQRVLAETARTGSETARDTAEEWATKLGSPVSGSSYSAKYWATHTDVVTVSTDIANVNTVATDIANVNTVATDITNVNIVKASIDGVNTVATDITNVNFVGTDIDNVNTVSTDITNVNTVSTSIAGVNTVAGSIVNVDAVGTDIANVNTVSQDLTNIDTVATNIGSVNTVAADIAKVIKVADDLTEAISEVETVANDLNETSSEIEVVATSIGNVDLVGSNINHVTTVATNITDVGTVATNIASVNTVAPNIVIVAPHITKVQTVATNIASVNTVSTDIADVNNCATNMAAVLDAPNRSDDAKRYADNDVNVQFTDADGNTSYSAKHYATLASTTGKAYTTMDGDSRSTGDTTGLVANTATDNLSLQGRGGLHVQTDHGSNTVYFDSRAVAMALALG